MFSSILEFRNLESSNHIKRIEHITRILLQYLNHYYPKFQISKDKINKISYAALLHDVGKIAIPDHILFKPGKLTDEEMEYMKLHTQKGCDIIESIDIIDDAEFFSYCYDICRCHHERYDGKGYPDGLLAEEIPIIAQVVGLADEYDILVSERVYKEAYTSEKAFEKILSGECGSFYPEVLNCFKLARKDIEKDLKTNSLNNTNGAKYYNKSKSHQRKC